MFFTDLLGNIHDPRPAQPQVDQNNYEAPGPIDPGYGVNPFPGFNPITIDPGFGWWNPSTPMPEMPTGPGGSLFGDLFGHGGGMYTTNTPGPVEPGTGFGPGVGYGYNPPPEESENAGYGVIDDY